MRILLVTQYFWPETFIINEIVQKIGVLGHSVTVLTGKPNYPDGVVFAGYTEKGIVRENYANNVTVIRVPLRSRRSNRSVDLLRNYLSFVKSGLLYFSQLVKGESFDVIFALQLSPVTSVIPAIYLSWRKKIPLYAWIQDLWPESLSATGHIKNNFLIWCVGKLVSWIYRHCDLILAQSHAFIGHIRKYSPASKVVYYGNSINIDVTDPGLDARKIKKQVAALLPARYFNVVFTGNIGTAQAVESLLEAAILLRGNPRFRLVLVGSGSMTSWLQEKISAHGLKNIILAGRYPQQDMQFFYARADALLVSLTKREIFALTVPTKIQSYLSAGSPILAAIDGEGARIVHESRAGFVSGAEDHTGLVANINKMMKMPKTSLKQMGARGRKYFLEHYEMNRQVGKLLEIFAAGPAKRAGA